MEVRLAMDDLADPRSTLPVAGSPLEVARVRWTSFALRSPGRQLAYSMFFKSLDAHLQLARQLDLLLSKHSNWDGVMLHCFSVTFRYYLHRSYSDVSMVELTSSTE